MTESYRDFLRSLPRLPMRESSGHKGTYGLSAILGGSFGMSGAVILAGGAALAAGSGLVRLLIPESILTTVAAARPEYMTAPLATDRKGRIALSEKRRIESLLAGASAVGIGPGFGRSLGLEILTADLYQKIPQPAVFDADALNALSEREIFRLPSERLLFKDAAPVIPIGPRILTPHPGEFARMSGVTVSADPAFRQAAAVDFVRKQRNLDGNNAPPLILVLKGAGTVVADGDRVFVNQTGNPGMGTGGAGDVLTGIITAFCAQKLSLWDAVVLGVALHGLAGDLVAESLGMESLSAGDLIRFLPDAIRLYRQAADGLDGQDGPDSPENQKRNSQPRKASPRGAAR